MSGDVKSLEWAIDHKAKSTHIMTKAVRQEKLLSPQYDQKGYVHVKLVHDDGYVKLWKVHTLVAMAFLGYDPAKYDRYDIDKSLVVHHINGDKADNDVKNLAVMTQRENLRLRRY